MKYVGKNIGITIITIVCLLHGFLACGQGTCWKVTSTNCPGTRPCDPILFRPRCDPCNCLMYSCYPECNKYCANYFQGFNGCSEQNWVQQVCHYEEYQNNCPDGCGDFVRSWDEPMPIWYNDASGSGGMCGWS
jgi:hypothetical protein